MNYPEPPEEESHHHTLEFVPEGEERSLFEHHRAVQDLFAYFKCRDCGEHFYMLKEDLEKRSTYWEDTSKETYAKPAVINLQDIQERGTMFYFDKDANEWVLLYTIIS